MILQSLKQRARITAGCLVYQSGLYQAILPVGKTIGHPLRTRLYAYLQHYLATRTEAERTLFIEELGIKIRCDLLDHMLAPYLEGTGEIYEWTEIQHCRKYCKGAEYIVDIGANHGFWGLSLSQSASPQARLLLFEANPRVASRLRKTLLTNRHISGQIFPFAVAEHVGEATFYLPRAPLSGLGSIVLHRWAVEHDYLEETRKIIVPTVSLDALVQRQELVGMDLLKIDVERAEDQVVAGGLKAIARFRPRLIMCETSVGSAAWQAIHDLGYESYRLSTSGEVESLTSETEYWGNVFFTPCQHV
jgi:FkbM family methyltransferase